MKKKLLITLGCSFTEGVGCYDPELIKQYPVIDDNNRGKIYDKSKERFHNNGWPAKMRAKLNYDKLINLGKAGTGESFHLKRFIEEFGNKNLTDEYDVLVVWLTSPQGRLSFYVNGTLRTILLGHSRLDKKTNDMATAYLGFIKDLDLDTCLEQVFYIKTLKEICNGKNYNFLVFPLGTQISILHGLLDIPENMGVNYSSYESILPDYNNPNYASPANCGHPNEEGYALMADRMFEIISNHNPSLINNEQPTNLTQEWRDAKIWK